jgi:hypothetical protein
MAAATMSSPKISPQPEKGLLARERGLLDLRAGLRAALWESEL